MLVCCVFILNHSRYFPCDFFSDCHMFMLTCTHFCSAQPTLTECLPGSGLGPALGLKEFIIHRSIQRLFRKDGHGLFLYTIQEEASVPNFSTPVPLTPRAFIIAQSLPLKQSLVPVTTVICSLSPRALHIVGTYSVFVQQSCSVVPMPFVSGLLIIL